jgi:tetratricopeptide (TPR) repeat protein
MTLASSRTTSNVKPDFREIDRSPQPVSKYFMVPYDRNEQFTGRVEVLRALTNMLREEVPSKYNHRVALFGMGGVGKTQTAIAYVYTNKTEYEMIFWISAASEATLLSGYQDIARCTECTTATDPKAVAKAVLRWLTSQKNWLVIIDNLDHIEIVKEYLPDRAPDKHTLITTRNPNARGIPARGLEIPLPGTDESIEMLCTLSEMDIDIYKEEAQQVAEELGFLPLAIDQAASYVLQVTKSFLKFLAMYQKHAKELRKWVPEGNRQYKYSVATTWSMSFEFVRQQQPQIARLFECLSFLNPDGTLVEFLESGKDAFSDDVQEIVSDPIKLQRALLSLEKFSLIRWSREHSTISIHRLIQAAVQDEMTECIWNWCASTVVNICDIAFPEYITNDTRLLCRRYQCQTVAPLLRIGKLPSKKNAEVCKRIGTFLTDEGKFKEGEQLFEQALFIYCSLNNAEHADVLNTRIALGEIAWRSGSFLKAIEQLQPTLATSTRVHGEEHACTLAGMNNLAVTYRHQGRWIEAGELQEKILRIRKRVLGEDHPDTLQSMNNLAITYRNQGRWIEAAELQEKTLRIRKRVLGEEHPDTLSSMNNLANTYSSQGRWIEAAELDEKTLRIRKRVLGEEHPETLRSMNNLSLTYSHQGRWIEAAELREKTLRMRKRVLGEEHPDTLSSMNNLANTYSSQGRWIEAAELREKTLRMRKRVLGEDHPDTLLSMNNLAIMYSNQGRWIEATELREKTLRIQKEVLREDHPDTLRSMNNLSLTYQNQGRWIEAAELQEKTLRIMTRVLGENHPHTLSAMKNLAITYRSQGQRIEAAELQEKPLRIEEQGKLDDAVEILERTVALITKAELTNDLMAETITELGVTYSYQGRHKEAVELLQKALAKRRDSIGETHLDTLHTMYHLAEDYRCQQKWDEAAELQENVVTTMKRVIGERHPKTLEALESLRLIQERVDSISFPLHAGEKPTEVSPEVTEPGKNSNVRVMEELETGTPV